MDGLKGYITNTSLRSRTVIENDRHLWQIEKAFRISKTELRLRPIYQEKERRIKAPICIVFVAYTIWKELKQLLHKHNVRMSAKRAAELTQNMHAIDYTLPESKKRECKILKMKFGTTGGLWCYS